VTFALSPITQIYHNTRQLLISDIPYVCVSKLVNFSLLLGSRFVFCKWLCV